MFSNRLGSQVNAGQKTFLEWEGPFFSRWPPFEYMRPFSQLSAESQDIGYKNSREKMLKFVMI
jgi:hypothetical protein